MWVCTWRWLSEVMLFPGSKSNMLFGWACCFPGSDSLSTSSLLKYNTHTHTHTDTHHGQQFNVDFIVSACNNKSKLVRPAHFFPYALGFVVFDGTAIHIRHQQQSVTLISIISSKWEFDFFLYTFFPFPVSIMWSPSMEALFRHLKTFLFCYP